MQFEQVEKAKSEYTDKYVVLVSDRPEHARFAGAVGQVKTINMSGRALVEWLGHHEDIGWYDIDLDYLKVVEKPAEPVVEKPKVAKKPVAKKGGSGLSPLEQLRQQGGATPKKAPAAAKSKASGLSPLEQLRQQGGTKQPTSPSSEKASDKNAEDKPSTEDILAKLRKQGGN